MEVFSERLRVVSVDEDGKLYQKVSRAKLTSQSSNVTLDYNSLLFPMKEGDVLDVVIYKGVITDDFVPKRYEYVMAGKCYEVLKEDRNVTRTKISFGGLLLFIESTCNHGLASFDDVGFACVKV